MHRSRWFRRVRSSRPESTGIRLGTKDARSAHVAVAAAGLEVGDLLDWPDVPLMFSFLDLDGNRFYVSETSRTS